MNRILDVRGSGKTKQLMLFAKEHNYLFVCALPARMQEKAYSYGIVGINFVSYSDFLENHSNEFYVVDELELFVKVMMAKGGNNKSLVGYTLSTDD